MVWGAVSLAWIIGDALWRDLGDWRAAGRRQRASVLSLLVVARDCGDIIEGFLLHAVFILSAQVAHWEIVVIDDGSVDDTPAVVERLARREARLRWAKRGGSALSATDMGLFLCRSPLVMMARLDKSTDAREVLGSLAMLLGRPAPAPEWKKEEVPAAVSKE